MLRNLPGAFAITFLLLPLAWAPITSADTFDLQVDSQPSQVPIVTFGSWSEFAWVTPWSGNGIYTKSPEPLEIEMNGMEFRLQAFILGTGSLGAYELSVDGIMRLDGMAPGTIVSPGLELDFDLTNVTLVTTGGSINIYHEEAGVFQDLDLGLDPLSFDLSTSSLVGDLNFLIVPEIGSLFLNLDSASAALANVGPMHLGGALDLAATPVPEPGTALLVGLGIALLGSTRRS